MPIVRKSKVSSMTPATRENCGKSIQMDYKAKRSPCRGDISLVNELNKFFGRFEDLNNTHARDVTPPTLMNRHSGLKPWLYLES